LTQPLFVWDDPPDPEGWEWEALCDALSHWIGKHNPDGLWSAEGEGIGWRRLSGRKTFAACNGEKFLRAMLPGDTDCVFRIYPYDPDGLAVNSAYHDAPAWSDWRRARPVVTHVAVRVPSGTARELQMLPGVYAGEGPVPGHDVGAVLWEGTQEVTGLDELFVRVSVVNYQNGPEVQAAMCYRADRGEFPAYVDRARVLEDEFYLVYRDWEFCVEVTSSQVEVPPS
jgi:hypothetical protein